MMNAHIASTTPSTFAVCCANVKYSPNIGDGLLSECLETGLRHYGVNLAPTIDLAGRTAYGQQTIGRSRVLALLDAIPGRLRQYAVRAPLAWKLRKEWRPHYQAGLSNADAVVIGGGNLLSDHDLNFPTKLRGVIEAVADAGRPYVFFACGMGGTWTREGEARLLKAFHRAKPVAVFLRDTTSKTRWDSRFAGVTGCEAIVVRDPGLLTATCFPKPEPAAKPRPLVGVGIISQLALSYHAKAGLSPRFLRDWYTSVFQALAAKGIDCLPFTNGAPEDRAAADTLLPALQDIATMGDGASVYPIVHPDTPAELASAVARCDAVAAFRLHALIPAQSYGIPTLGLAWDDKVASFMASIDRDEWLFDPVLTSPDVVATKLVDAAQSPIPAAAAQAVVDDARADIGRLFAALSAVR